MNDYRKYLLPDTIAKLQNIELRARLVVEGFITGLHRSPYHGFSVEFAEHRQYRAGDEIRHIDWKVYARSNKYYVKQFEEETNLRSIIAIDKSASMGYASKGQVTKYQYACYLGSALAFMMMNQRDAVGLSLYDEEIVKYMPAKSKPSYIAEILKALDSTLTTNKTGTAKALDSLAERVKRRGLVIVISDFFDDPDSVLQSLKHFRHQNHEVIAFHLMDPREVDFKFGYAASFKDMETGEEMITQPFQIENSYRQAIEDFKDKIKKGCYAHNIDYHFIQTDDPFDKAMRAYLSKRAMM